MINSLQIYFQCGESAGKARKQKDNSRADFQSRWFSRAVRLETAEDRKLARQSFDSGYRQGYGVLEPAHNL